MSLDGQHLGHIFYSVPQIEVDRFEFELLRFDLREVENVIDESDQRGAARAHDLGVLALFLGQLGVEQEVGHSHHTVHRRADLVAHVGQELALRSVGELCLQSHPVGAFDRAHQLFVGGLQILLGLLKLLADLHSVADVGMGAVDEEGLPAGTAFDHHTAHMGPPVVAVLVPHSNLGVDALGCPLQVALDLLHHDR